MIASDNGGGGIGLWGMVMAAAVAVVRVRRRGLLLTAAAAMTVDSVEEEARLHLAPLRFGFRGCGDGGRRSNDVRARAEVAGKEERERGHFQRFEDASRQERDG